MSVPGSITSMIGGATTGGGALMPGKTGPVPKPGSKAASSVISTVTTVSPASACSVLLQRAAFSSAVWTSLPTSPVRTLRGWFRSG